MNLLRRIPPSDFILVFPRLRLSYLTNLRCHEAKKKNSAREISIYRATAGDSEVLMTCKFSCEESEEKKKTPFLRALIITMCVQQQCGCVVLFQCFAHVSTVHIACIVIQHVSFFFAVIWAVQSSDSTPAEFLDYGTYRIFGDGFASMNMRFSTLKKPQTNHQVL